MNKKSIVLAVATLIPLLGLGNSALADGVRFTADSLNGTYYIPCACEGTAADGTAMYTGGTGKVFFNGKGEVTLRQQDVYLEQDGTTVRLVANGVRTDNGFDAERSGRYSVNSEGFGEIVWNDDYGTCTSGEDCPLLYPSDSRFRFSIADDLKILSQQRTQPWDMRIQPGKECVAGITKVLESLVVAVVEHVLLEELPKSLDEVEIRAIGR